LLRHTIRYMNKTISILFFLLFSQIALGQYQIGLVPRVSPDKAVYQKIGNTEVHINYGSPAIKNRAVWGELVPFNEVWRAGANNATTVNFSTNVTINNTPLASGKYALFVIPKENDKWSIIFNKTYEQWGAFRYNAEEDALRIDVLPKRNNHKTEYLSYSINQTGYKYGSIVLKWEYLELDIPFETNYLEQFKQDVESRTNQQPEHIKWVIYLQGAEHLLQIHPNEPLAMSWINKAEKIMDTSSEWNDQFYPKDYIKGHLYWTKAKLLAQANNFKKAVAYATKIKALKITMFYDRNAQKERIDSLITYWQEN